MDKIKIFENPAFGKIRTAGTSENPLFCAADVCKALGLSNPSVTKERLVRDLSIIKVSKEVVAHGKNTGIFKEEEMYFVSEPGFYRCIFRSNKKSATTFQNWVFNEVLPSLRTTGGYIATTASDTPEDIMARAVLVAQQTLARREERIKQLEAQTTQQAASIDLQKKELAKAAPKVDYYDKTLASKDCMTTTQVADDLHISARTLNLKLQEKGIIYQQSGQWHLKMPYKGWNLASTRTYNRPLANGNEFTKITLVWNQRGKRFILALYNNDFNIKAAIAEVKGEHTPALSVINK